MISFRCTLRKYPALDPLFSQILTPISTVLDVLALTLFFVRGVYAVCRIPTFWKQLRGITLLWFRVPKAARMASVIEMFARTMRWLVSLRMTT